LTVRPAPRRIAGRADRAALRPRSAPWENRAVLIPGVGPNGPLPGPHGAHVCLARATAGSASASRPGRWQGRIETVHAPKRAAQEDDAATPRPRPGCRQAEQRHVTIRPKISGCAASDLPEVPLEAVLPGNLRSDLLADRGTPVVREIETARAKQAVPPGPRSSPRCRGRSAARPMPTSTPRVKLSRDRD
jgi:hypothetical protein